MCFFFLKVYKTRLNRFVSHPTMPATKARKYCYTSFSEDEEPVYDSSEMNYMIYGKETCPITGRKHFQGYVEFKKQKTFNQAIRHLPHGAHLEVARGSFDQNRDYCIKENDFKEFGASQKPGSRSDLNLVKNRILAGEALSDLVKDDDCAEVIARHFAYFRALSNDYLAGSGLSALKAKLSGAVLRTWQSHLINSIISNVPDPRHVYWFWDAIGSTGKSFMADYLIAFHGAVVFTGGKVSDIAHAYNYQSVVIFDLARTQEDKLDGVYMCLENFKNGRFFSPKYESHNKVFAPPHVLVFANFEPDRSKLSADRWKVHHLCNGL